MSARSVDAVVGDEVRPGIRTRIAYRPDIDGLRAISVLAVILFHSEVPGFAGGFVGVDVFFVISGYLITQVLMAPSERTLGAQLRDFYVRRCRRILPALIAMLVTTAAFAYWLLLPDDLARFGTLLGATSVFIGNVVAWRSGGYFDPHPFDALGHLWSLAVEEQFYVVFPLVFLASAKAAGRKPFRLLAGCAVASLALCAWASYRYPVANFFLAPTRAWELLLGSLVALGLGRSLSSHPLRGVVAGAAVLALAACVLEYDRNLRYPGLYAIVPCGSAALLLATNAGARASLVGRWLGTPALVFVGLISYSLYLWHLPVLTLARYYSIVPLEPRRIGALLATIFVLAAATWRYIEAPLRRRAVLASDARFLAAAGAATLAVGSLGLLFWQSGGLAQRLDPVEAKLAGTSDERLASDLFACARRTLTDVANGSLCTFGPPSGAAANVLVWGDSHAIALLPAYDQIATARNVRVHAAVLSACLPLRPVGNASRQRVRATCNDFNVAVGAAIERIDPALVILNAYWLYPDGAIDVRPDDNGASATRAFEAAFENTLRTIGPGRKICVIGDVPALKYKMPLAYIVAHKRGLDPGFIALRSVDADRQLGGIDQYFEKLARRPGFSFVDPRATLCSTSACALLTADGRSLYRDDNHLTLAGAELLRPSLESCFDSIE